MNSVNSINSTPTFKGSFVSKIDIIDTKRLANIQKLFADKTKQYPSDVLTLRKAAPSIAPSAHELYAANMDSYYVEDFSKWLVKYSDNEIAKKLVRVLKGLKAEAKHEETIATVKSEISRVKKVFNNNKIKEAVMCQVGNIKMADRYKILADMNQEKMNSLIMQGHKAKKHTANQLNKIMGNDSDLEGFRAVIESL